MKYNCNQRWWLEYKILKNLNYEIQLELPSKVVDKMQNSEKSKLWNTIAIKCGW